MPDRPPKPPKRFAPDDPFLKTVRRATLLAFAGALIAMALLGVFMLLFSASGRIIGQVFGSLLTVVIYGGIILAVVHAAMRGFGPRWYCWVVCATSVISIALVLFEIWSPYTWRSWPAIGTAVYFGGAMFAAWPSAVIHHQQRWREFALAGMWISLITAATSSIDVWLPQATRTHYSDLREQTIGTLWSFTAAVFQTGLLGMLRRRTVPGALVGTAVALGWTLALVIGVIFFANVINEDLSGRIIGVLAILTTCATLLCGIVAIARFGRSRASGPDAPLIAELELVCPVCAASQRAKVGDDRCTVCACRFQIKVTPVNCPGCGYALADLPERRCPECGHAF